MKATHELYYFIYTLDRTILNRWLESNNWSSWNSFQYGFTTREEALECICLLSEEDDTLVSNDALDDRDRIYWFSKKPWVMYRLFRWGVGVNVRDDSPWHVGALRILSSELPEIPKAKDKIVVKVSGSAASDDTEYTLSFFGG